MQITCPACGKKNEVSAVQSSSLEAPALLGAATVCARCGCDLSQLRTILRAAQSHLSLAKQALKACDWADALSHAEKSWQLVHTPHSVAVASLASAALGESGPLARWQRRGT